jgi:hypothetical protein
MPFVVVCLFVRSLNLSKDLKGSYALFTTKDKSGFLRIRLTYETSVAKERVRARAKFLPIHFCDDSVTRRFGQHFKALPRRSTSCFDSSFRFGRNRLRRGAGLLSAD